jgi:hypothetical protein
VHESLELRGFHLGQQDHLLRPRSVREVDVAPPGAQQIGQRRSETARSGADWPLWAKILIYIWPSIALEPQKDSLNESQVALLLPNRLQ